MNKETSIGNKENLLVFNRPVLEYVSQIWLQGTTNEQCDILESILIMVYLNNSYYEAKVCAKISPLENGGISL
jgi:hypothetical protein